jgi:hypothetical protein
MNSHSNRRNRQHVKIATIFCLILVALPVQVSFAQNASGPAIDVSGHLDVRAVEGNTAVKNNDFQIGQFVLDLSSNINDHVAANMQIAYADEARDVVVDEAYADWGFFRWDGRSSTDPLGITKTGMIVGQFDVPFGLDWRSYNSIDRHLVSVPLVISETHRGWNDLGVQFYAEATWANWAVFAVNGFGTSPALRLDQNEVLVPRLVAAEEEAADDVIPTEAYGARFGLYMTEQVEFGTSFAAGYGADNDQQSRMFGFDVTAAFEELELKAEFISRRRDFSTGRWDDLGYYVQGVYAWGKQFGVVRGDVYRPDGGPADFSTSAGAGYLVHTNAQLRIEYRMAEGSSNDTIFLQTAIAF